MFTKSSPGNIKSPTMKEFLLIVSLSLVFLSVESYRQKYHGKYFQYGPYGRSSLSGLRGGLSGGFDDGFRTTSFSGSSLDDFVSLGSLGSLSSSSTRGFSASSGLSLSGLQGLDDDSFSSNSPAPILPQNSYRADPYSDLSYPNHCQLLEESLNSGALLKPETYLKPDPILNFIPEGITSEDSLEYYMVKVRFATNQINDFLKHRFHFLYCVSGFEEPLI
uniref:Uncharacterized protein n=1 Tax=Magallana gigas TaxID=29159 RepID=A0A8W8NL68_MAGGI